MKLSRSAALAILLTSSSAGIALAQPDSSVGALRQQIAHLERKSASGDTPAAMVVSTQRLLTIKHAQLSTSLRMQLDALRKYQDAYGSRFTPRESRSVSDAMRALENELLHLRHSGSNVSALRPPIMERGHAEKPLRRIAESETHRNLPGRSATPLPHPTSRSSQLDHEFLSPSSPLVRHVPTTPSRHSSAKVLVQPAVAVRPPVNMLAPAPPANTVIPIYWESGRNAPPCPPKVTTRTTVTFHLSGINDLIIDFDTSRRLVYRVKARKYAVSQVPEANPFLKESAPLAPGGCGITAANLPAALAYIRTQARQHPRISPPQPGGESIPLSETAAAARGIAGVGCILGMLSQDPNDPVFQSPNIQGNQVFQWIKRIAGPHEVDLSVDLEPDFNYDFKFEEVWKGEPTDGGTINASCGETDLFTLSLGPMISTLPSRTYDHNKVPISPGSSTTQDVLTVGNTKNINVLGAALLNYHLPRFRWLPPETGFALSAGPVYTLGSTPEVSALGLFVGMSVHLNRSIFITPGVHIGEFADFPAGFAPGSVIPDGFGNLNPVKRRTAHFAVGLTYKTASLKKSSGGGEPAEGSGGNGGNGGTPGEVEPPETGDPDPSGEPEPPTQPNEPNQPDPPTGGNTPTPTPLIQPSPEPLGPAPATRRTTPSPGPKRKSTRRP